MTLEEIKDYCRIDSNEDDSLLTTLIETSEIYINSMVGKGYKSNEEAVKLANLLQKKLILDMYENRATSVDGANNIKRDIIVESILDKLSLFEEAE